MSVPGTTPCLNKHPSWAGVECYLDAGHPGDHTSPGTGAVWKNENPGPARLPSPPPSSLDVGSLVPLLTRIAIAVEAIARTLKENQIRDLTK